MGSGVPLEIEGVVEALATPGAQVAFDLLVTPHVSLQQTRRVTLQAAHGARREGVQRHETCVKTRLCH